MSNMSAVTYGQRKEKERRGKDGSETDKCQRARGFLFVWNK